MADFDADEQASIMNRFRNGLDKPSSELFNSIFGADLVEQLNWSQGVTSSKPAHVSPAKASVKKKTPAKGPKKPKKKKLSKRA